MWVWMKQWKIWIKLLISLPITIVILGILAVAVISAVNPVEQVNRGKDAGSQADAKQLLMTIERFDAANGYFPWLSGENASSTVGFGTCPSQNQAALTAAKDFAHADNTVKTGCASFTVNNDNKTDVLEVLVKSGGLDNIFVQKLNVPDYNTLFVYNDGKQGDNTYVCFQPKSAVFIAKAKSRCTTGLPADLQNVKQDLCNDASSTYKFCLP